MSQEIVVTVSPSGMATIEANGFTGEECIKATQNIELALSGGRAVDRSEKPEFHAPATQNQENNQIF